MKIAVISDIHDNLENLKKCLQWCKESQIAAIFCCGDVTNNETLRFISDNYSQKLHLVDGNCTMYSAAQASQYKNIIHYGRIARFELAGRTIGLCHEPFLKSEVLKKGDCDIIFYGHTHKPWEEDFGSYLFVNPGALGGANPPFSFAVWDTDSNERELKIFQ